MPHIKLLSTCQTPYSHMEKLSSTWYATWRRRPTYNSGSSLIPRKASSATVMRISQEIGTGNSHPLIPVPPSHKAGGSSSIQDAPSHGPPNFSLKLHCLLPRLSTSLCHKHYMTSFPSWLYYRKWGSKTSRSFASNLMSTAKYLKTMQEPWNSQGFQSYIQGPST